MDSLGNQNLAMVDSLIDLISCLRLRQMSGQEDKAWKRLLADAERFTSHLALHIVSQEANLFAALKRDFPQAEPDVDSLERDHAWIRAQARDLIAYASEGDSVRALDHARSLLRKLMDHVREEERTLEVLTRRFTGKERAALRRFLEGNSERQETDRSVTSPMSGRSRNARSRKALPPPGR